MRPRPVFLTLVSMLALAGCKEKVSPEQTAAHLKAAQDLYAQKDYTHALVEVQGAIKGNPGSGDAHYLAGQIQEGLGNPRGAFEEYARAAVPDANNLKAQLKVAEILIDAKQLDAALGRINGTLGSHPNDPDVLALRALAEQRQGSKDKARNDAQAALGRAPGQPIATAVLASDALASQNAGKALELIGTGLKAHPEDPALLRLKAAAMLAGNKKDDAIGIYQNLVATDPASVRNRAALAELEAQAGRVPEGEKVLRDGVAAAPASADMRAVLIGFLDRYGTPQAAEAEVQAAIAANPQASNFDLLHADRLLKAGNADGAAEALRSAAARVPEGPARQAAQLGLARLEFARGNADEARKLLDTVLTAKADNDEALMMRATLTLRANDPAKAIPDLLAVAGRQPRNPAPFSLLADAYVQQGDFDKAADAQKKVAYFQPADLAAATRLAEVDLKANKPDLAKAAMADFVTRNPDSTEGRAALVRLLLLQKDWTGAQAAIDALRRQPRDGDRLASLLSAQMDEAKGQPDVAMALYGKQLGGTAGKPLDRDALQGYLRSAAAARQADQALATLQALAPTLSGTDAAMAQLAIAALDQAASKPDQAATAATAAITAAPKEAAGYLQLAGLQRASQPQQAVATLNQGIAAGAAAEPLLLVRGTIQDQSGDRTGALASYHEALKTNPRSLMAANNYASLVADAQPKDTAALTEARATVQRFSQADNPALLDTLAWLDYRLGDLQSAKALLVKAKAETSPNPQLRYHYGAVLIALGDKDQGRTILRAALAQQFPGHAEAERLLTD